MVLKKYDVVMLDLNPRKGHTQAGIRPGVVVQSNLFNTKANTVIIVPLSSVEKQVFPSEFWITPGTKNGLTKKSRFLGSQIMTLDKHFIGRKVGRLENKYWSEIKKALEVSLDWDNEFS